jgi:hypothetical protein
VRYTARTATNSLPLRLTLAWLALSAPVWGAATLTLPAANPPATTLTNGILTSKATIANCITGPGTTAPLCTDTAFVSNTLAGTGSVFLPGQFNGTPPPQSFNTGTIPVFYPGLGRQPAPGYPLMTGFTQFNKTPAGSNWIIIDGGALTGLTITVNMFSATILNTTRAGMTIRAAVTTNPLTYTGPAVNRLVWTQVTYDNFFPPSTPAKPATLLDSYSNNGGTGGPPPVGVPATPFNQACIAIPRNAAIPAGGAGANRAYCDPIYPFQNGSAGFFDRPNGRWSVPASFRAIALLSTVTTAMVGGVLKDVLTVYDAGFTYGFDLKTPEPSLTLVLSSMLGILFYVHRRRRSAKPFTQL